MKWIVIEHLHRIYLNGETKANKTLLADPRIRYLLEDTKELRHRGNRLVKGRGFDKYYERWHKENYGKYCHFLVRTNLKKPQTRFEENDIKKLIDIEEKMASGELVELRKQIIEAQETVRGVSLMFFKNEKYLLNRHALTEAVKQLLKIDKLADERDQQYKYVLECDNPETIVLCENIDFLKRPSRPRQHNIELWYAGGKNIAKLDYAETGGLPIYYSCDWDYDGLKIYELVKQKIPTIQLLYPTGDPKSIESTEHKSKWGRNSAPESMYGLNPNIYNEKEKALIRSLVDKNQWVVEESNDLIIMVSNAKEQTSLSKPNKFASTI